MVYKSSAEIIVSILIPGMREIDITRPVAVTGGSGYLASWIIKHFLDRGMNVRTSVRNLSDKAKYNHLLKYKGARTRLKIFEADLLKKKSFDELINGCELVIHTASPFKIEGINNYDEEVIEPALEGTKNVLSSVNRICSVKRVVLTASMASINGDAADVLDKPGRIFTHEDWNSTSTLKHQPYSYSKTIAEIEAWEIANFQDRWDLITIHPGFILGPSLTKRTDSTSINFMITLLRGRFRFGVPDLWLGLVDVRDASLLHVLAALNPSAKGRYIAIEDTYSMVHITEKLVSQYGTRYNISTRKLPKILFYIAGPLMGFSLKFVRRNVSIPIKIDNSRSIEELGMAFRPIEATISDQVEQIEMDGLMMKR
jgi:nucleoside-diphosphate-sugar epimerase